MENPELVLTPTQVAVLHQLAVGFTRHTIAEALFLSPRSLDNKIAETKQVLGTPMRLCLGIRAVRYRLVSPTHPVHPARSARLRGTWHPPTNRQLRIIHFLANNTSLDGVSSELGISSRTVRCELSSLAATNGARNATHAGALFEALGWTRHHDESPQA